MRLLVACRAIDNMAGGVERQATSLMNEMHNRGHQVALYTLDQENATSFYPLNSGIEWFKLAAGDPQKKASLSIKLERMKKLRTVLKHFKPDALLGFQHGTFLAARLYGMLSGVPMISAERESPYRFDHLKAGKYRELWMQSFRLAENITVQCESYIPAYPEHSQPRITVIPNPVREAQCFSTPDKPHEGKYTLLCVGRLTYQKNQEALLTAFAKLAGRFPEWDLVFVGEGDDRRRLQELCASKNLTDRVSLPGAVKDVSKYYLTANALCIPSRWEGFPNVLGEALAHGLPAVGYAGCGGVPDLISHGSNGLLADGNGDVSSLEQQLSVIMTNNDMRASMSIEAIQSVRRYTPSQIYDRWENYLTQIANNS